ncbi:2-isopropylmalate synthase [Candidatus Aerophobetes bacterium]|uniref:2-isopropylmalate synthase n=1 Tax=Aerophobetes bacterium TaxID=2030807 RepID=A0A523UM26_UNCAE|nr:MAG: 2-isopropylmalate synthase [Candidatus Aerophobetes bacterium]
MKEVMVFDTTLRDGEQSPGASLTVEEKLEIARQLERLKVDVIETGFPASSPGDFEAVRRIAREVKTPVITALARALPSDIEKAGEALKGAKHKRIHTFIATSSIHMEHKLRMSPRQVLSSAVEAVQFAKQFTPEVEFSPEDASRSDLAFLCEVIQAVIERGATVVNIPDTVGYCTPDDFGTLIGKIYEKVPHLDRITLSIHCHDDLGMATANSIAGIKAGARQVECTINGIGERAGNASLEEIVMALVTRRDLLPFYTNINTSEIYRTSRLVSRLTGIPVQPNKAIVGENAFRHEAGIHQDGVLKESATYEIMTPDSIGLKGGELVLGKHSGRHAFKERMKKLGFRLDTHQLEAAFKSFKELTDKKKEVFDEDLIFMGEEQTFRIPQVYVLEYIHTVTGNQVLPTATVRIKKKGKVFQEAACGDGPIDAAYRAIDRVTRMKLNLLDYSLHSVTGGKDALGEVMVKVEAKGRMVTGRGVSTDIIEAGAKAYLNAINRLIYREGKRSSC